ncbi:MFS transporter [Nucisporomicrobium flavum]|uniref:MFS transporter n=1 Tax=Nucisporomicrobium flavum TaxID=2785915 RepID=UPI003C2FDA82
MTGRLHKGSRGGVLRDGAFRRLWAGTTVSQLGTSVAGVATPLIAVQVLDAGPFQVSLLTAVAWLPWLLVGLPAGAWMDRVARRPVMLAADVVSAVVVLSVPVAAWLGVLTMGQLLVVAMALGVATVFFSVAWTAYLPAMFDDADLVTANSVLYGTESGTQVAGPAVGGVLIAAVSAAAGLVVDGLSFLISALCVWRIRRPERRPAAVERRGIRADIAAGARWLLGDPYLRNLMVHGAAANLALTGMNALLVVFLVRDVRVGTAAVGLLLAVSGVGGVAAASLTPLLVRRVGGARALVACKSATGLASLLVPWASRGPGLALFVAGMAGISAGAVAANVISGSFRQAYCPPAMFGRILTCMQFVNYGAIPVGAVLGGAAAAAFGTRTALVLLSVEYALSGLIVLFGPFRGRRDLPASRSEVALAG